MDFNNYIFRSHMVGDIINPPKPLTFNQKETLVDYTNRDNGEGRPLTVKQKETLISLEFKEIESKKFSLSGTAKSKLADIVFYEKYGRINSLSSKYLDKGITQEKAARDLLSKILDIPLVADEERKANDWVTGKRDIDSKEIIFDIKSKWDFTTYAKSLVSSSNELYLRQLDCYMDLWGIRSSILCHILVDTPVNLVERELRSLDFKNNVLTMGGDVRDECIGQVVDLVNQHIYTREGLENLVHQSSILELEWFGGFIEIPESDRIHMINHDYDQNRIEQRNESIILAREYMNTIKPLNNIIK